MHRRSLDLTNIRCQAKAWAGTMEETQGGRKRRGKSARRKSEEGHRRRFLDLINVKVSSKGWGWDDGGNPGGGGSVGAGVQKGWHGHKFLGDRGVEQGLFAGARVGAVDTDDLFRPRGAPL